MGPPIEILGEGKAIRESLANEARCFLVLILIINQAELN